jgi:NTP pyrophosphatase (non-canonical NTP hydrolase)
MTELAKLWEVTRGLNRRFPNGNNPFQIMTRLLEEGGELAQMVNHFEGAGIKREKYGVPDRSKMSKEIMDVLRCALQTAIYYNLEAEVEARIAETYERMLAEGLIDKEPPP